MPRSSRGRATAHAQDGYFSPKQADASGYDCSNLESHVSAVEFADAAD